MAEHATARLLGDVGGTNARFAWQDAEGAPLRDIASLPTADHATLADAITAYLKGIGRAAPPWCAIGIANPITGDQIRMTNCHWAFSISAMREALGLERLVVINDFTALALALPDLPASELRQLGGAAAEPGAPIGLIGPGTGLGVSGLIAGDTPGRWMALQGEGGHVTLAASNLREATVLQVLRDEHGHVSAERAVSGQGLEALYSAVCKLDGVAGFAPLPAAEVSQRGLAASDAQCVEALDLFCAFLGNVAGNLALTLGARGGVYIGGGIVPRLGDAFARSRFRACFEDKGRFCSYLEAIPVFVIHTPVSPALLGAARAL
ncbi:MAG: glucokinase [Burkholderiales bacterium]